MCDVLNQQFQFWFHIFMNLFLLNREIEAILVVFPRTSDLGVGIGNYLELQKEIVFLDLKVWICNFNVSNVFKAGECIEIFCKRLNLHPTVSTENDKKDEIQSDCALLQLFALLKSLGFKSAQELVVQPMHKN